MPPKTPAAILSALPDDDSLEDSLALSDSDSELEDPVEDDFPELDLLDEPDEPDDDSSSEAEEEEPEVDEMVLFPNNVVAVPLVKPVVAPITVVLEPIAPITVVLPKAAAAAVVRASARVDGAVSAGVLALTVTITVELNPVAA